MKDVRPCGFREAWRAIGRAMLLIGAAVVMLLALALAVACPKP